MKIKLIILLFLSSCSLIVKSQSINIEFPYFAGKTYDFIIFQGDETKIIQQGTIPANGKFVLSIPPEFSPYTGMSRWLITNSQEGGGLDMVISGKDFSVTCKEKLPNDSNIIYQQNDQINELNVLYKEQQTILTRYNAMLNAINAFSKNDENYKIFEEKYQDLIKQYELFQDILSKDPKYVSKFLQIVNFSQGIGTELLETEKGKAQNMDQYVTYQMDWKVLYTSAYWSNIISSWITLHTQVLKDIPLFAGNFEKISNTLSNDKRLYVDFVGRVAYFLNQQGKDNYIHSIAPLVRNSGKINAYQGSLALYQKNAVGTTASDLIVKEFLGDSEDKKYQIKKISFTDLLRNKKDKKLLVFYDSGCGHCDKLLNLLPMHYDDLKAKGISIISISADKDTSIFKEKSQNFKWKDKYCDYEGFEGENFKNYAIIGTPTLLLIGEDGKILLRTAELDEVLNFMPKSQ